MEERTCTVAYLVISLFFSFFGKKMVPIELSLRVEIIYNKSLSEGCFSQVDD